MAVGTAAPPSALGEQKPPFRQRHASLIAAAAGVVAAATAGIAHSITGRSIPQPAGVEQATVVANAYGLVRLDGFQIPDSLSDRIVSIHLALYTELSSAADRMTPDAGALRGLLLVVVVAGALALFTLCRQFGMGAPTAFGVVLLAYVAPAVATAEILVYPATIAGSWLLVAAILLSARPSGVVLTWLARAAGVLLIGLAALLAPVSLLLPVGVIAVAALAGTLFPRWGLPARLLAVAGLLVLVVVVAVAALGADGGTAHSPIPQATAVALAVVGLALAGVATWRVLWIRPLAIGCVPLFAAAFLRWDGQPTAVVLGIAVIAVLLAALVEETLAGLTRSRPLMLRGLAVALVAACTVGLLVLPASTTDADGGSPQSDLAGWLEANTAVDTRLQVDPLLWVDLMRAGVPAQRLQRTDSPAAGVEPAALVADRGADDQDLPLVARFGAGTFGIDVRQRVADPVAASTAILAERLASQTFGTALADNPNLSVDEAGRSDLVSGDVDSRLLTVLATAAAEFVFTIDSFPRANGADDAGTLRTARISDISRLTPVATGAASDSLALRDFFRYQLLPYRPLSQGFDNGVLVVVYSAPSPVGLLS